MYTAHHTFNPNLFSREQSTSREENSAQGWLSVDPLASERSWLTPYNFVQNNPIMRFDPDGRLDGGPGDLDNNEEVKDGGPRTPTPLLGNPISASGSVGVGKVGLNGKAGPVSAQAKASIADVGGEVGPKNQSNANVQLANLDLSIDLHAFGINLNFTVAEVQFSNINYTPEIEVGVGELGIRIGNKEHQLIYSIYPTLDMSYRIEYGDFISLNPMDLEIGIGGSFGPFSSRANFSPTQAATSIFMMSQMAARQKAGTSPYKTPFFSLLNHLIGSQ